MFTVIVVLLHLFFLIIILFNLLFIIINDIIIIIIIIIIIVSPLIITAKAEKDRCADVVATTWNQSLYANDQGEYFINSPSTDDLQPVSLSERLERIEGGENKFYCIHGQGQLSEMTITDQSEDTSSRHYVARLTPVFTSAVVTRLSCGKEHCLFLTEAGQVYSFGLGSRGQLGHGSVEAEVKPRQIECLDGVMITGVSSGGWHSAAISETGDLFTWGWNESGQLGHLDSDTESPPRSSIGCPRDNDTSSGDGVAHHATESESDKPRDFSTSVETALELVSEKTAERREDSGHQLEGLRPALVSFPRLVTPLPQDYTAILVSCGSRHTAVVTDDGKVFTTGWNKYGQLGHGGTMSTDVFTEVSFEQRVSRVTSGAWNTVFYTSRASS